MKIIDRYLLRQFLRTFFICFLSLTGLYIVFDAFTNLEEFLRTAEKAGGLGRLMGTYYAYRSILFFDRTSALLTLVSAMFTVTWIQRHNELVALMAAGISRGRVVAPIIAATIVLILFAAGVREGVIPRLADELARQPSDLLGDTARELKPTFDNYTEINLRGKSAYRNERRIALPVFWLPPGLDRYGTQLTAENAYYRPAQGGRPGGYLFDRVREPKDLDGRASLELNGQPVIITRRDAPDWLQPGQCFVVSYVTFDQLAGGQAFRQFSSTLQLIAGLRNPSLDFGADVRVGIHCRIVQPLLDMTMLFLGLPLVLSRQSRNVFVAIGLCLAVVSLFLMVVMGFQYLGSNQLLRPALAAWAPLMIFVPLAVAMSEQMWE